MVHNLVQGLAKSCVISEGWREKKAMSSLLPTFENQSSTHSFSELQTVQRQNVVENNGPEVGGVENTSNPARHSFTHTSLNTKDRKNVNSAGLHCRISSIYKALRNTERFIEKYRVKSTQIKITSSRIQTKK